MKKCLIPLLLSFVLLLAAPFVDAQEATTPGFYKDLFMSGGLNLRSRTTLPAAESLGLSYEYYAGKDAEIQKNLYSGSEHDTNGVLLYPDGAPRFRMLYVNGGGATLHGKSLELSGRQVLRQFYRAGGSYCGSCAGSFLSGRNVDAREDRRLGYLHIFPYNTSNTGLKKERVGHVIPDDSPLTKYRDFGGDQYVADIYHNNGNWLSLKEGPHLADTEILATYDTPGKRPHGGAAIWAYKTKPGEGRIVNIGSHPEGITEGERLELTEACFLYALDGVGTAAIKGTLHADETRVMDRQTTDEDSAHTRIGDRQYHHFRFEVPAKGARVTVTLTGEAGIDYSLFLRKEGPAFQHLADFGVASAGHRATLRMTLSAGSWYVSVQCLTSIQAEKDESGSYYIYSGDNRVLNGVAYTLQMDQKSRRPRREATGVSSNPKVTTSPQ